MKPDSSVSSIYLRLGGDGHSQIWVVLCAKGPTSLSETDKGDLIRSLFGPPTGFELQQEQCRFDNVEVVQERFGVFYVAEFGLAKVVLLADVIIPVHPFGQEAFVAVMMPGDSPQNGQAVAEELLVVGIAVRLEVRQRSLGVFPQIGCVPAFLHIEQALCLDAVPVVGHFELVEAGQALLVGESTDLVVAEQLGGLAQDTKRH